MNGYLPYIIERRWKNQIHGLALLLIIVSPLLFVDMIIFWVYLYQTGIPFLFSLTNILVFYMSIRDYLINGGLR